jgi:hypothetical protein
MLRRIPAGVEVFAEWAVDVQHTDEACEKVPWP